MRAVDMAEAHDDAEDAPAQSAEYLPIMDRLGADRAAAAGRVAGLQLGDLAKAADRFFVIAIAPGADADPAEVSHRVAEMGAFPVEHALEAVGADQDVAVAEIAMHQAMALAGQLDPLRQPAEAVFEAGIGMAEGCHQLVVVGELFRRVHRHEVRQVGQDDAVQPGGGVAALEGELGPRGSVGVLAQDAPAERLAVEPPHDEAGGGAIVRREIERHLRHRHAGPAGQLDQPALGRAADAEPGLLAGEAAVRQIDHRVALQDQRESVAGRGDIEGPGLAAGAAGELAEIFHRRVGAVDFRRLVAQHRQQLGRGAVLCFGHGGLSWRAPGRHRPPGWSR